MDFIKKIIFIVFLVFSIHNLTYAQQSKYKCMIQMTGYQGLKAYVVVSLVDAKGNYEKTLAVLGPDKQWYNTLTEWYKFQNSSKEKINGLTGASIGGGDRAVKTFEIESSKMNKGYTIRFESAVEHQKYHKIDVEVPVTDAGITERVEGEGYVRFVKLSKIQ